MRALHKHELVKQGVVLLHARPNDGLQTGASMALSHAGFAVALFAFNVGHFDGLQWA